MDFIDHSDSEDDTWVSNLFLRGFLFFKEVDVGFVAEAAVDVGFKGLGSGEEEDAFLAIGRLVDGAFLLLVSEDAGCSHA